MPNPTEFSENAVLSRLFELIKNYLDDQNGGKFVDYHNPSELTQKLSLDEPGGQSDWDQVFSYVEKYLTYAVRTHHDGFANRMWSGANLPSIVGEIVAAVTNTCAGTYESAPVSTLIEKYMIRQMLEVVGFQNGEGQMTTGSSNANMIAMLAARNSANKTIKTNGLFAQPQLYAFVSQNAHYSMDKAANIIGIGIDHLIKIKVDQQGEMDLNDLEQSILKVKEIGGVPFFVTATAGTTLRGAFDNIEGLLKLRHQHSFWLHVDGAWGGATIFSQELRQHYLKGIEKVNSFTWDFHKMAGTAMMCNVLLFNNRPGIMSQLCRAGDTSYIFRDGEDSWEESNNLGSFSFQCGRKVDSLKWFLDWKYYGLKGFANRVEKYHQLCQTAEHIVKKTPELEMVVPRNSFNVCFRYKAPNNLSQNEFNLNLRNQLYFSGLNLIGYGYIESELCLRLLITNSKMDQGKLNAFFKNVVETGKKIMVTA